MKRNMDLVRKILFQIEDQYIAGTKYIQHFKVDGYDANTVYEHCLLLKSQELIVDCFNGGTSIGTFKTNNIRVGNLTNKGYELLDKIREDTTWNTVKETIVKKGLPMTFDVLLKTALSVAEAKIKGLL